MYPNDSSNTLQPIPAPLNVAKAPQRINLQKLLLIVGVVLAVVALVFSFIYKSKADTIAVKYINSSNIQLRGLVYEDVVENRKTVTDGYQPLEKVFLGNLLSSKYRQTSQNLQPQITEVFVNSKKDLATADGYALYEKKVIDVADGILAFSSATILHPAYMSDEDFEGALIRRLDKTASMDTFKSNLDSYETIKQRSDYNDFAKSINQYKETQRVAAQMIIDADGPSKQWKDQRLKDMQKTPLVGGGYNQEVYNQKAAENLVLLSNARDYIYSFINRAEQQLSDEATGFAADARRDKLNQDIISLRENLRTFLNN